MVAELAKTVTTAGGRCSLAKISMVAEQEIQYLPYSTCCSLAKISMVAEQRMTTSCLTKSCSLAKISMVAEP